MLGMPGVGVVSYLDKPFNPVAYSHRIEFVCVCVCVLKLELHQHFFSTPPLFYSISERFLTIKQKEEYITSLRLL